MTETPAFSTKERIWKKDAIDLIGQLKFSGHVSDAKGVVKAVGYDDGRVRKELEKLTSSAPQRYFPFVESLKAAIGENDNEVKENFDQFLTSHPEMNETRARRLELEKRVIKDGTPTQEQSREVKNLFVSGNFLEHSSSVRGAIAIAGDPDVAIKSPEEIRKVSPEFKGQGGVWGISFGFNGVDAMPGTWRHMVIFVTSPEAAMVDGKKSIVPYRANPKELQMVGAGYDRDLAIYAEATFDFLEIRNSLDRDGVKDDFSELEKPIVYEKGKSPIELDLTRLKEGALTPDEVASRYQVVEGQLVVNPDVNEQELSLGLVFADFLLKHTPEGRSLGKDLVETTPQELLEVYRKTTYKIKEIEDQVAKASETLKSSMAVSLGVEKTVMFVPEEDVDKWLDVFARVDKAPAAFVTFTPPDVPKVPNWTFPEGHKAKAESSITSLLKNSGVPAPSISYASVLGKDMDRKDIIHENMGTGYLKWGVVAGAKELVLSAGKLKLQTYDGELIQTT